MPAQSFTAEEVNTLLPQLEAVFEQLEALESELGARSNEIERIGDQPDEHAPKRREIIDARAREFEQALAQIEALGGLLMDLELQVVDFPSERAGQPVFLSWQRGESAVSHFHAPDDHFFRGRRRLAEPD